MSFVLMINPGGVGCKYIRKGTKNTFGAIRIVARWGGTKTGYRWYAVQHINREGGFPSRPFVISAKELRSEYDPTPTKAKS